MRIAILTSPRSGSTSMFRLIDKHFASKQYISVSEPFNNCWRVPCGAETYDIDFFNNKNNVFIKTFIGNSQIPKSFTNEPNKYWHWFFEYFDKIIILDRKNKQLQGESLTYHLKKKNHKGWHQKQYYDLTDIKKEDIEKTKNNLIQESKEMHSLTGKGYPIFYFEEIFIEKNKNKLKELFKYIELTLDDILYDKYVCSNINMIRLEKKLLI